MTGNLLDSEDSKATNHYLFVLDTAHVITHNQKQTHTNTHKHKTTTPLFDLSTLYFLLHLSQ